MSPNTVPPRPVRRTLIRLSLALQKLPISRIAVALLVNAALASLMTPAQAQMPRLYTNESLVEDVTRKPTLAIDDPIAVFAFVLNSLPDKVTVYPTENYYYFWFYHGGNRYAGNIRIDVLDRDAGKLHFAYFKDFNEWSGEPEMRYSKLDETNGVKVEKVEPLLYRVTYGGKSVLFALNDLTKVAPPSALLGPDEKYIGPVFDESAIRFFLVYNTRMKIFLYLLDETTAPTDELIRSPSSDRLFIARRTGFAFYRDHKIERKILVGVFEGNSRSNNYYDGPFDQLPDNFIEGETLRTAILEVAPELKGRIDRFGIAPDAATRYMIGPYLHYRSEEDLDIFHECATSSAVPADDYYNCFVIEEADDTEAEPPPPPQKAQPKRPAKKR